MAARRQFGELGYRGASLRAIATEAGVDPRLVLHYFGSKQGLFIRSVELPLDPEALVERIFAGDPAGLGRRAAEQLVAALDDPVSRQAFLGLLRTAVSEPEAAEAVRELLTERILTPLARRVGGERPELRAGMLASQVVGLVMGRHVVGIPALTSADRESLVRGLAPVVEHYLTGAWVDPMAGRPSEVDHTLIPPRG
jgi:AcrR family transcriptional regulator